MLGVWGSAAVDWWIGWRVNWWVEQCLGGEGAAGAGGGAVRGGGAVEVAGFVGGGAVAADAPGAEAAGAADGQGRQAGGKRRREREPVGPGQRGAGRGPRRRCRARWRRGGWPGCCRGGGGLRRRGRPCRPGRRPGRCGRWCRAGARLARGVASARRRLVPAAGLLLGECAQGGGELGGRHALGEGGAAWRRRWGRCRR